MSRCPVCTELRCYDADCLEVLLDLIAPTGGTAPTVVRLLEAPAWGATWAADRGAWLSRARRPAAPPTVLGVIAYLHHARRVTCAALGAVYGCHGDTVRRWLRETR